MEDDERSTYSMRTQAFKKLKTYLDKNNSTGK